MQVKQVFNPELVRAVLDYFQPHRDKEIHLVKFVTDPDGDTMLLVRMTDEWKKRWSTLMSFEHNYVLHEEDMEFSAREEFSVPRTDEAKLLAWFVTTTEPLPDSVIMNPFC